MNAERLAKIEEIYYKVSETPAEERASFLSKMCGDDDELYREVESLLSYAEVSSDLIDTPPLDVAAEIFSSKKPSEIIGKKIGHYKILSQIGEGGMGEVFLAEDLELERQAAIKFIKPEFAREPDQLRRFLREAKTASSLNHPNIITVYEIGKTKNANFIATEFIKGKTLREVMKTKKITFDEMLDIAAQIATALHAAHSAGIFHRDIKPENIMLREDKLVKVLDFGLAKLQEGEKGRRGEGKKGMKKTPLLPLSPSPLLTASGVLMGTAGYMSPEQARVETVDARSDVWSLGVVLYEMCTGHKPFKGKTSGEMIDAILENEPAPPCQDVPDELNRIIAKALEKDADKRYQTAQEFLLDLENFRKEFSVETELGHNSESQINKTSPNNPNRTNENSKNETHNVSSAEYIVGEVKKHKSFSSGFLIFVFIALIIGGYFYFAADSQTVNSIAVLPFVNESGDSEVEYLSDGISESLINSLSQLSDVKVIAGSSTFKYKGKEVEPEEIARALGVKFILRGRISQRGDNLQVSARLIDAINKTQIWGEQFNRKKSDILDIETEISQKIADRLHIHLTNNEQNQLVKSKKINPQAYEMFLKGRFYQSKGGFKALQIAVKYYEDAIAIEPNYAKAYAALANIYLNMGANSFQNPSEMMPKAKASATKALELDENLAEVHLTLAGIKKAEWNWTEAERKYNRAIELNPNLSAVYFSYSFFLSTQKRHDEAISAIKKARELDPLKPHINTDIGYVYYFARQYDAANEQYKINLELDPNYAPTYYGLGFVNAAKGQFAEAAADYKEMLRLDGDHTGVECYLGFALAKSGQTNEAEAILKQLETGKEYVSPVELAVLYVGLNKPEKAISALERAYTEKDSQMQFLGIEPHFDSLRDDPRFQELLRRVGLE